MSPRDSGTYTGGPAGPVDLVFGDAVQEPPAGPLPEEELRRLRRRFTRPPRYEEFKRRLAGDRLLVLSGRPGTGRMCTALSLLDEVTRGRVSRLDPCSDLTGLGADGGPVESVREGYGYALEPAGGRPPAGPHLDRLRAVLAERGAWAVLLAVPDPGDPSAGRTGYHRAHESADAADVRDGHLAAELGDLAGADAAGRAEELRRLALAVADLPEIKAALGLESLLPAEAARFAALLARHVTGGLDHEGLIAGCRDFAAEQVRRWFAGGARAESLPAVRDAAYRVALAVFGGGSCGVVAEAAELLAWELAVTVEPERVTGRPLFGDGLEARLASARATVETRPRPVVAGQDVPVRTVRFRGERLAPALLAHLWEHHHNMRGPVLRWLDSLGQDRREEVWARAAVAAGELCRHDCAHTLSELLVPLAEAEQPARGLFVATALEGVLANGYIGAALRALIAGWGDGDDGNLRRTAAVVLGRGTATATVAEALDRLGRIGTWEEGRLRVVAGESVVHLAGAATAATTAAGADVPTTATSADVSTTPTTPTTTTTPPDAPTAPIAPGASSVADPLTRIRGWLADDRRHHRDLGLVATVLLTKFRVGQLWNPAPELAGRDEWPLAPALAAAYPGRAAEIAGLVRTALDTSRSYEAALDAVAGWLRTCRGAAWEDGLLRFLPLLSLTPGDRRRLLPLVEELSRDSGDPADQEYCRRLRAAVTGDSPATAPASAMDAGMEEAAGPEAGEVEGEGLDEQGG